MNQLLIFFAISLCQSGTDIFEEFLADAPKSWSQVSMLPSNYVIACDSSIISVGDNYPQGNSSRILFKRKGDQRVAEINSDQGNRVFGINNEYAFWLEPKGKIDLVPKYVGDDEEGKKQLTAKLNTLVGNPEHVDLLFTPNAYLPSIPWENPEKVKFVSGKINILEGVELASLKFNFDFDDSITGINGRPLLGLKEATLVFDRKTWLPREITYITGFGDIAFETDRQITRDSTGVVQKTTEKTRMIKGDNKFPGQESSVDVQYQSLSKSPRSSEFRLPHYGFPEFKKPAANWYWRIGLILVVCLIFIYLYRALKQKK